VFSFDNGTWAVAFTVTEWYLPSKKSNKGGLTPDHVVPKESIMKKAREVIANFPYPLPVVLPAVAQ
jgi:C-terminal processing protease CtpA/Prc